MKKHVLLLAVFLILAAPVAIAEQPTIDALFEGIDNSGASKEEKCHAKWALIWPLAKAGDLEARFHVFGIIAYSGGLAVPKTLTSMMQEILVSYIHALGAPSLQSEARDIEGRYPPILNNAPYLLENEKFRQCVTKFRSHECAALAVEQRLIPSYELFAHQIDLSISNDSSGLCKPIENQ